MREMTQDQITIHWLKGLRKAVNCMFLENVNFESDKFDVLPFYEREYPGSGAYYRGPMKVQAEFIIDEIDRMIEFFQEPIEGNDTVLKEADKQLKG